MKDFKGALKQWLNDFHSAVHLKTNDLTRLLMGQASYKAGSKIEHLPMLVDEVVHLYYHEVNDNGLQPGFETLLSVVDPQSFAAHMVKDDPNKFGVVKDTGQGVIQDLISLLRKQLIACEEVVDAVLHPIEDTYIKSMIADESMSVLLNSISIDTAYFDKPFPVAAIYRFNVGR